MRTIPRYRSIAAWVSMGLSCATATGETIQRDWPQAAHGSITVDNSFGSVEIRGWSEPRIRLRGDLGTGASLSVRDGPGADVRITVRKDQHEKASARSGRLDRGAASATRLVLHVPHSTALTVTSVSADVSIKDIRHASRITVNTVSGDHDLAFTALAAKLKSVSGTIRLTGAARLAECATISGDIDIRDFAGGVEASVVSGDLGVQESRLAVLNLDSVSGDINVAAAPLSKGLWRFESLGGDIDLRVPELELIALSVDSFSGTIEHGDGATVRAARNEPAREFRSNPRNAEARVVLNSFSGDIRIRAALPLSDRKSADSR